MEMKSICRSCSVENPAADYKSAVRIGNFRFGEEAVYIPSFPGTRYLPLSAPCRAWMQQSVIAAKGCCGAQIPIYVLRVQYEGGFWQNFAFDRENDAEYALELIRKKDPELPGAPEKTAFRAQA